MKIPNYDSELVVDKTKHKSLLGNDFRMLVCGSSGCGKILVSFNPRFK